MTKMPSPGTTGFSLFFLLAIRFGFLECVGVLVSGLAVFW